MENRLSITKSITIHAPASEVWDAITNPELVKQYFFGTNVRSDWKEGSPITYTGVWEGKEYVDKGIILKVKPFKYLKQNYWSSFSETEDIPENYSNITYELEEEGSNTVLTITQDGFTDKAKMEHSDMNWGMVLDHMKSLVEKANKVEK